MCRVSVRLLESAYSPILSCQPLEGEPLRSARSEAACPGSRYPAGRTLHTHDRVALELNRTSRTLQRIGQYGRMPISRISSPPMHGRCFLIPHRSVDLESMAFGRILRICRGQGHVLTYAALSSAVDVSGEGFSKRNFDVRHRVIRYAEILLTPKTRDTRPD